MCVLSIFIDFRVPPSTPWSMSLPQALFFLKKHAPGILEHVSCGFCQFSSILGSPQVVPAQNDADDGGGGDEPTTATPHSHQQANTHRDQISRSEDTPSL